MGELQLRPRPRILIVDDEPILLKALKRSLDRDHEVTCVEGGEIALGLVISSPTKFDAIVCDLRMAGMSGQDLYAEIVKAAPEAAPSMIFMSGETWSPQVRRFLAAVPNACFEKPVDIRDLRARIQRHFRA